MNALAENLWHAVQGACTRGMSFLHEDASIPHQDSFSKKYNLIMRRMFSDSAELEAENQSGSDAALNDLIADLIANRH